MADSQADTVKSPIIMKVDGPDDEKEKEENEENEKSMQQLDNEIKPSQVCSPFSRPSIVASSHFSFCNNPFAPKSNNLASGAAATGASPSFRNVLRPSQLGQAATAKSFTLNPSKLNPFTKTNNEDGKSEPDNNSDKKEVNGESLKFVPLLSDKPAVNQETPKFVPLLEKEKTRDVKQLTKNPTQTSVTFVFGQNLQERVVTDEEPKPSTSLTKNTNGTQDSGDHSADMLFSSAIKETPVLESNSVAASKSLSESAREYEEQRANKRKYEEVEVKTGEEDETNVLHVSCKLFAFDKSVGNWQERGRGNLRLNDQLIREEDGASYVQSRIVFRTSGVLRVILNTKIWAEMTIEQASAKSVRFTAMDSGSGEIRVFLVMAGADETKQLYKHLQERLSSEQKRQNHKRANNNKDFDKEKTSEPPEDK